MQTSEINISKIITEGKLKTYKFGTSFIEVYWSHEGLHTPRYSATKLFQYWSALKIGFDLVF